MNRFIQQTLIAAKETTKALSSRAPNLYERLSVGAGGDRSLRADLLSEEIFATHLRPFGSLHSEESGFIEGEGSDLIYLDPLDGSDNFASGIPYFGASIALCDSTGTTKAAVVVNFCSGEAFIRGEKETLAGNLDAPLSSFTPPAPPPAPSAGIFEGAYRHHSLAQRLNQKHFKFRSPGAVALSMAYASRASFLLCNGKSRDYDTKAGLFLCSDLHIYHDKHWWLISRDKATFDSLLELISEKG